MCTVPTPRAPPSHPATAHYWEGGPGGREGWVGVRAERGRVTGRVEEVRVEESQNRKGDVWTNRTEDQGGGGGLWGWRWRRDISA